MYARDQRYHNLRYRLLAPALGLASYDAEAKLLSADKDITFDAGVGPPALTDLIGTEGVTIRNPFCK